MINAFRVALNRWSFISAVQGILRKIQLSHTEFNTHSFGIGAATTAKEVGISELDIKILG